MRAFGSPPWSTAGVCRVVLGVDCLRSQDLSAVRVLFVLARMRATSARA